MDNKILIIDDDEELCELVTEYLTVEGFETSAVHDGESGLAKALEGEFDLAILDVMLPKMNGFDVLRQLREVSQLPVLMLTARGDDMERIVGLEIGADDYLPKPFNPRELVARLRAILRRVNPDPESGESEMITVEDVTLSTTLRSVEVNGEPVSVTSVEFALLAELLRNAGKVSKKEDLSENVLERSLSPYDRSLDMHISNLRKKLGPREDGTEQHQDDQIGRLHLHNEMNLFLKIFLWFLATIALMFGLIIFLNWSVQTEPVVSRWQASMRNQTSIFSATAAQIYDDSGEDALLEFLDRIKTADTITEIDLIGRQGNIWVGDAAAVNSYQELVERTFASDSIELELSPPTSALSAGKLQLNDGSEFVMIVRWERPQTTPMFGASSMRYLRYGMLLFTAILVCYALAWYLSSPIEKMRRATQKFAAGDLSIRVADDVGNRHDELGDLAMEFDVMAERIESLIMSQQRLSRDVSHELRSPLARMNVALEIAKQRSNGEINPILDRIEKESSRLNEMISRLLTLSQLESGSGEYERHELNLATIIEQIAVDADFEAKANGRSVKVEELEPAKFSGNEALVRSAIENVLRNAVRYTAEGTEVTVKMTSSSGNAQILIEDHGGGVPDEELKKLFTPFYRVGEARERKTGGIGLGLAIAEQAVKLHKGTISAANTIDGLAVEIMFPLDKKA